VMEELIRYLLGWQEAAGKAARPLPKKPVPEPETGYPAGATEEEKLRIAQERIRAQREAEAAGKPRDIGGPFGKLPERIRGQVEAIAGEKPKKDAKKPWYKKGLYDLF